MGITLKTNGSSFRAAMESRAANLKVGKQRRIVLFAMTLHRELVLHTPILTGKAKAEWQIGLDSEPNAELLGRTRPPTKVDYDTYAQAAEQTLQTYQSGQTIYIVNNAPYIAALNAGSSRQAPAYFIESVEGFALSELKATLKGSDNG